MICLIELNEEQILMDHEAIDRPTLAVEVYMVSVYVQALAFGSGN